MAKSDKNTELMALAEKGVHKKHTLDYNLDQIRLGKQEIGRSWLRIARAVYNIIESKQYEKENHTNYKVYFESLPDQMRIDGDYATQCYLIWKRWGETLLLKNTADVVMSFDKARQLYYSPKAVQEEILNSYSAEKLATMSKPEFDKITQKGNKKKSTGAGGNDGTVTSLQFATPAAPPTDTAVTDESRASILKDVADVDLELAGALQELSRLADKCEKNEVDFRLSEDTVNAVVRIINRSLPVISRCEIAAQLLEGAVSIIRDQTFRENDATQASLVRENYRTAIESCSKSVRLFEELEPAGVGK